MKKTLIWGVVAAIAAALLIAPRASSQPAPPPAPVARETLNDRQVVWVDALEWCESRAVPSAINPKDRDNTPSYGLFQFKPGTLTLYAKQYGITVTGDVMSTTTQRAVVEAMVLDAKNIDWHQQFPDCVKKLGLPPA